MIWALLLAQADAAAPVPDEVTVMGKRLGNWRGTLKSNPLGTHCRTDQSTGDAALDRIGCEAMLACWAPVRHDVYRLQDKHLDAVERERLQTTTHDSLSGCVATERRTRIAALAAANQAAGAR